jgi:hypothetical protein
MLHHVDHYSEILSPHIFRISSLINSTKTPLRDRICGNQPFFPASPNYMQIFLDSYSDEIDLRLGNNIYDIVVKYIRSVAEF